MRKNIKNSKREPAKKLLFWKYPTPNYIEIVKLFLEHETLSQKEIREKLNMPDNITSRAKISVRIKTLLKDDYKIINKTSKTKYSLNMKGFENLYYEYLMKEIKKKVSENKYARFLDINQEFEKKENFKEKLKMYIYSIFDIAHKKELLIYKYYLTEDVQTLADLFYNITCDKQKVLQKNIIDLLINFINNYEEKTYLDIIKTLKQRCYRKKVMKYKGLKYHKKIIERQIKEIKKGKLKDDGNITKRIRMSKTNNDGYVRVNKIDLENEKTHLDIALKILTEKKYNHTKIKKKIKKFTEDKDFIKYNPSPENELYEKN